MDPFYIPRASEFVGRLVNSQALIRVFKNPLIYSNQTVFRFCWGEPFEITLLTVKSSHPLDLIVPAKIGCRITVRIILRVLAVIDRCQNTGVTLGPWIRVHCSHFDFSSLGTSVGSSGENGFFWVVSRWLYSIRPFILPSSHRLTTIWNHQKSFKPRDYFSHSKAYKSC